jgi:hypothetical protein
MTPTPPPPARRHVIPLFPDRPAAGWRLPARIPETFLPLVIRVRAIRLPPEVATIGREAAGKGFNFLAPAILLAAGASVLALLAGNIAVAAGRDTLNPAAAAATTGAWTFIATTGGALLKRGLYLARTRWT